MGKNNSVQEHHKFDMHRSSLEEQLLGRQRLLDQLLDQVLDDLLLAIDVLAVVRWGELRRWGHPVHWADSLAHVAHWGPRPLAGHAHLAGLVVPWHWGESTERALVAEDVLDDLLDDALDDALDDLLDNALLSRRLEEHVDWREGRRVEERLLNVVWQDGLLDHAENLLDDALLDLAADDLLDQNLGHGWLREEGRLDWHNLGQDRAGQDRAWQDRLDQAADDLFADVAWQVLLDQLVREEEGLWLDVADELLSPQARLWADELLDDVVDHLWVSLGQAADDLNVAESKVGHQWLEGGFLLAEDGRLWVQLVDDRAAAEDVRAAQPRWGGRGRQDGLKWRSAEQALDVLHRVVADWQQLLVEVTARVDVLREDWRSQQNVEKSDRRHFHRKRIELENRENVSRRAKS